MGTDATVTLPTVTILRGTAKEVLVRIADGAEWWVPQSVIHDDSPCLRPGDAGDLVVAEWWYERQVAPKRWPLHGGVPPRRA